jgi:hypothetical protein
MVNTKGATARIGVVIAFICCGSLGCLQLGMMGANAAAVQVNKAAGKAIYDAAGGEKAADVTYRTMLPSMAAIVEQQCNAAPTWSEFEISCDARGSGTSPEFLLTTGDGSTMNISLSAADASAQEVHLVARIQSNYVEGSATHTRSAGPAVPIFANVLRNVDNVARERGIKKIRGGFSDVVRHSGRSLPATAGSPAAPSESTVTVAEAQRALNGLGYGCGTPDGKMGQQTRSCVAAFQRDRALPVTGDLDSATLAAIPNR